MSIPNPAVGKTPPNAHTSMFSLNERNLEAGNSHERISKDQNVEPKPKKTLQFHLSFLALNLMVLMVSLDATALAVATPVRLSLTIE
jgi:hypothetical protein